MSTSNLTPRLARESKSNGNTILFDRSLTGFGLRIHPSGRKVWIVQARIEGRSRRIVIARYGEMELAEARRRARDILARIRAGENPADDIQRERETRTLREFADEYLRRCNPHWKPSGRKTVRNYVKSRILPTFGKMPLDRIGPEDVAAWFDAASKERPGAANRAFEILRAMMFRGEEWGLRERGTNPCLGIAKNPRKKLARFLDIDELARLGRALDAHEGCWPEAVAAIRLLALTGCRRGEVLNLRWRDIGGDALNLADSKTGPRAMPLGKATRAHIDALPGPRNPDAFLFPSFAHGKGYYSFRGYWRRVCADAKLGSLRLRDLRHTAASQAVMAGEYLPLVGKLLGHQRHRTTAGYAHLADPHLVEAAEKVGSVIADAMVSDQKAKSAKPIGTSSVKLGISERRACAVAGQHRSTQRKRPRGRDDEEALTAAIIRLASQYGRYGYRRITALLRTEGWHVNAKRVQRIWWREGELLSKVVYGLIMRRRDPGVLHLRI